MERQSVIAGGEPRLQLCEMEAECFTRSSIADPLGLVRVLGLCELFYSNAFVDCAEGNARGEFQTERAGICIL